ncbi:acyltransferase family protein [Chitinophaga sedimenti]|uniref:acyltransferase family protein n=1 Tax=Chitinophaga sedimenti TaxID=2033606 RepID=UPI00200665FE|nr:acyltransferase family protein [Chitinophaga sedimenti]MCK7555268.1 acyltransferase family protein [Chitinophaga sedimenti]
MQTNNRIYGLDSLRAIAMLLGIVLHAIIAYKVYPNEGWPSDDQLHAYGFDALYLFIHSFRMQLFFLVAGFFARMLYLKIGERAFFKHRYKRIVVPFIASMIFILPLSIAPFVYFQHCIAAGVPPAERSQVFWQHFLRWNGMAHLWFLYYLILYYVVMLVVYRFKMSGGAKTFTNTLTRNYGSPLHVIVYILILAAIQIALFRTAEVEVSTSIFPKPGHFTYYGFFFLLGVVLHRQSGRLFELARYTWLYLAAGLALTVVAFKLLVLGHENVAALSGLALIGVKLVVAAQTVFLTYGFIGFFLKYMNVQNGTIKYISDASFWLYLVHLSIVGAMQIVFLDTSVPGWLRPLGVLTVTTLIAMGTYQWFVRYSFIGTALHGPRDRAVKKRECRVDSLQSSNLCK